MSVDYVMDNLNGCTDLYLHFTEGDTPEQNNTVYLRIKKNIQDEGSNAPNFNPSSQSHFHIER